MTDDCGMRYAEVNKQCVFVVYLLCSTNQREDELGVDFIQLLVKFNF